MKLFNKINIIVICVLVILFTGCSFSISRIESDKYTLTEVDTTVYTDVKNLPGNGRDNGTIYPSPRVSNSTRRYLQTDTIVERRYPNFLRFGIIEGIC